MDRASPSSDVGHAPRKLPRPYLCQGVLRVGVAPDGGQRRVGVGNFIVIIGTDAEAAAPPDPCWLSPGADGPGRESLEKGSGYQHLSIKRSAAAEQIPQQGLGGEGAVWGAPCVCVARHAKPWGL